MRTMSGLVAALVLLLGACGSSGPHVGGVQESDGWIYYADNDDDALYRMRTDLTDRTRVSGTLGGAWEVHGDTIFWIDPEGSINVVGTDGSAPRTVVATGPDAVFGYRVVGDRIVYATKTGAIHRVGVDGTGDEVIARIDEFVGDLQASPEDVVYRSGSDLYRMEPDGSAAALLVADATSYALADGWVFFGAVAESGESKGVERIRTDGTGRAKVADGAFVAIDDEWLYSTLDDGLYRSRLDGSGAEKLNDIDLWNIEDVAGEHIYYGEYSGAAYRVDLDGGNQVRIGAN